VSLAESPPQASGRPRGAPKGQPMKKVRCQHCGALVTRGRPGKRHESGACKPQLPDIGPAPAARGPIDYQGDDIPSLEDIESEELEREGVEPGQAPPDAPGALPPLDTSILADVMDPMVVWPAVAEIPNAIIEWKAPHAAKRVEITKRQGDALHRALPYVLPRVLMDPKWLFAIMLAIIFVLPIGTALVQERVWKSQHKGDAEPAKPAEGAA